MKWQPMLFKHTRSISFGPDLHHSAIYHDFLYYLFLIVILVSTVQSRENLPGVTVYYGWRMRMHLKGQIWNYAQSKHHTLVTKNIRTVITNLYHQTSKYRYPLLLIYLLTLWNCVTLCFSEPRILFLNPQPQFRNLNLCLCIDKIISQQFLEYL